MSYAEIAVKQAIGKLDVPADFIATTAQSTGFAELAFTAAHAAALMELPLHHRDPFDRMLIAQVAAEGATFATVDPIIPRYRIPTV